MKNPQPRIVLPDTSLCAIVCDEIMNPAGGIVDFVDSTLPYVEAGVIVDTGSKDGTREALADLQKKYPNLEVYDKKFRGFADARNHSLKQCKAKRALVLDADERLTRTDFDAIRKELCSDDVREAYNFDFLFISRTEQYVKRTRVLNTRLFESRSGIFKGTVFEHLPFFKSEKELDVLIKHFIPDDVSLRRKREEFYYKLRDKCASQIEKEALSLHDLQFFPELKKYNPKREEYR